uniref:Putative homeobox protein knotted-1-like 6 n=1 Tax=Lupinus angustifolius TaxID=3871 RepID=A0A182BFC3_LUPAN|nr:putative homeobox protein knotted-1-like 6 [Lupinus angustifolius]
MEEMYGVPSSTTANYAEKHLITPENLIFPPDYHSFLMSSSSSVRIPMFGSDDLLSAAVTSSAAIQQQQREQDQHEVHISTVMKAKIASHPHYPRLLQAYIDCQKENYCNMLVKYKSDLARPFDEATSFLNNMEMQLSHLCTGGANSVPTLNSGINELNIPAWVQALKLLKS